MPNNWFNFISIEKLSRAENEGLNDGRWLHHRSWAKSPESNPYLLANEWICGNIAWHLRLPVPPLAIMRKSATSPRYFASLDYGTRETTATDMKATTFCDRQLSFATGIILFDILIANPDRHEKNLKVNDRDNPTRFHIFDHERALFGHQKRKGRQRLEQFNTAKLGFSLLKRNDEFHKLAIAISSDSHFWTWASRIEKIPEVFISELCDEAKDLGVSVEEADMCEQFLCQRKNCIIDLVRKNMTFFANIKCWGIL
jgi:hypothetical protein